MCLMSINIPKGLAVCSDRSSDEVRRKLNQVCDHFNIIGDRQRRVVSEAILRLGKVCDQALQDGLTLLPADPKVRSLFEMYRYFQSL